MKNNRYVFFFEYGRDWMIGCYGSNEEEKYFNSAENYFDDSLDYVDLFLENCGNKYHYELPDYSYVENIDIFDLANEPIKELARYLKEN